MVVMAMIVTRQLPIIFSGPTINIYGILTVPHETQVS